LRFIIRNRIFVNCIFVPLRVAAHEERTCRDEDHLRLEGLSRDEKLLLCGGQEALF